MGTTEAVLSFEGEVLGVPLDLELYFKGGPLSLRLTLQQPISIQKIWDTISQALYNVSGLSLPDLTGGPWGKFLTISNPPPTIQPSLWITPTGPDGSYSAYLELVFSSSICIGGEWEEGPLKITLAPNICIDAFYISYDKGNGGFDFKAKITVPTQPTDRKRALSNGSDGQKKQEIVTYPFPIPSQGSVPTFQLNYLGIGQRVGPAVVVSGDDPMATIFEQLETDLIGSNPKEILTKLANTFYHPDRDWFIAVDVSFGGFNLKVLFNDPSMYGLELTAGPTTPLKGLLFEILYQKLGPNLGVYYGALTLPDYLRRIVLDGVILILPGFSIWVYTNGDFKVNVGWPLGNISIGIQVGILVGIAGFYFAKLRSGDNPGAQPSVNYNPILEFGIGISVFVQQSFNASIFSATISVTVTATFQGLLAWSAGSSPNGSTLAKTPDHYWFAGTAALSVLIQGSVDFAILKASVTISLNANVGVAFETGYITLIAVSASVSVEVKVKVVFFTIHLSFSTSISHNFYIGSGNAPASINGPLAPGLAIAGGPSEMLDAFDSEFRTRESIRSEAMAAAERLIAATTSSTQKHDFRAAWGFRATAPPITLPVHFVLQPTAVYGASPSGLFLIASLFIESPSPQSGSSPQNTPFEQLIRAIVMWLLSLTNSGDPLSKRFKDLVDELGSGLTIGPIFGSSWEGFAVAFQGFIRSSVIFQVQGVNQQGNEPDTAAAMLPMIDALTLSFTGPDGNHTIDFDTYNPTPPNYPEAVIAYFEELSWTGTPAPSSSITEVWKALGSPLETPSMAAYLFYDYFLMQARNAARQLQQAADKREGVVTEDFLSKVESAHMRAVRDPWYLTDLSLAYRTSITGEDELSYLLDHYDYISAAGLGSRYMLQGLQLPDPASVPANPTPQNMAGVSTDGLYTLTGQQFPVPPGVTTGTAVISLSSSYQGPEGWIVFDTASPPSSSSSTPLPSEVPSQPAPAWHGASLLRTGSLNGEIDLNAVPPLAANPLYYGLKNRVGWTSPVGPNTIFPLPQPLSSILAQKGSLQLAVSTLPPDQQGVSGSPGMELPASAGLLIRLSLSQVPQITNVNAGPQGSPSGSIHGSPGGSGSVQYLPFVYQLNGTDDTTRDLIQLALEQGVSGATVSMLYTPPGGGNVVSQRLDLEALIAKVNLSTLNQAPRVSALLAARLMAANTAGTDFALVSDAPGFLRLIWELSVVNATGYLLYYLTEDGQDLPAELFSDAGVGGGQTAQFDILVQLGAAANPTVMRPWENCIVIAESSPVTSNSLYAAVLNNEGSPGTPVLQYSPSYLPGNIAFDVVWQQAVVSPEPLVPVDHLYQLIQFSILSQGSYRNSVWSLPAGPTRNQLGATSQELSDANTWNYQQSVPAYRFVLGSPSTGTPYVGMGQPVSLGFRLIDIYGNPLPDVHQSSFTPLYNDPLAAIAEWPGVATSFYMMRGISSAANLVISALFDPDTVVLRGQQSPPLSSLQPTAGQQWEKIQARFQLILCQLDDPNVTVSITTSLTSGTIGDSNAIRGQLLGFVNQILIQIQNAIETSSPAEEWSAQPVPLSIELSIPFSSIVALPADIFPVSVNVGFARDPNLVYSLAATELPSVIQVSTSIPPNLHLNAGSPPGSPSSGSGIRSFALLFENAFTGFDGAAGYLKMAQRAGISTGEGAVQVDSFWAVRWSETAGISVDLDLNSGSPNESLVYFAVRPLSTRLMAGQVNVGSSPSETRNFANIDIDLWAYQFLQAFDAFLSPGLAVAIAILDQRNGTTHYQDLLDCKENLASVVPLGLLPVFSDQANLGDMQAAQQRLTQAMLISLSSAYSVSTILQAQASVSVIGISDIASPVLRAPQLYGTVGPIPSNTSPTASPTSMRQYTISPGELSVDSGGQWLTTLVSVAQPTEQAELQLPLTYQVSYLQHDFGTMEMGYTPSSWLKFVLPGDAPLNMPISACAQIPIPLMFSPNVPSLLSQTAEAASLVSPPPGSPNIENEIARALEWNYTVQLGHTWALQDELFFEVTFNETAALSENVRAFGASRRTVENLFGALARFQLSYPEIQSQLNAIMTEAYPQHGAPVVSPGTAQAVIQKFEELAIEIESVWPDYKPVPTLKAAETVAPTIIIEDYFIQLDSGVYGRMHLFGHGQTGAEPAQWPVITAGSQVWDPHSDSPFSPTKYTDPGGTIWWQISHDFSHVTDPVSFFREITVAWMGLDIRQRQTATLSANVKRNASLVTGRQTSKEFIYDTETAHFASPVIPLIQRAQLQPLPPGPTLANTLQQIFDPIALVGYGLDCYMRVSLEYEYQLANLPSGGMPLTASMPILLADDIAMGSSSPIPAVAAEIAQETAAWYNVVAPSTVGAVVSLQLALFGTVRGQQLPLLQIGKIPILVGAQSSSWWSGPV
jgi:hypothetical protein